jgi:hypothetical protein
MPLPGGDHGVIHGGSCSAPMVTDAEVYIGFDGGMTFGRAYPWNGGAEVFFRITDQDVPKDEKAFAGLVTWTLDRLKAGAKVHAGCIGGHGRTGLFLAALVASLGEKDAIQYVRQHYCGKAVESQKQVNWLVEHYGVSKAEPRPYSGTKVIQGGKTTGGTSYSKWKEDWDASLGNSTLPMDNALGLPRITQPGIVFNPTAQDGVVHYPSANDDLLKAQAKASVSRQAQASRAGQKSKGPSDTGYPVRVSGNIWGSTPVLVEGKLSRPSALHPAVDFQEDQVG